MRAKAQSTLKIYEINDCIIDLALREISYALQVLRPEKEVFNTLVYLIEQRDHAVTVEELRREVWRDNTVSEFEILRAVVHARRAILDSQESALIAYVAEGPGYQFRGDVLELEIS